MKRSGPLKRKTALRSDPAKVQAWKDRTRKALPAKSTRQKAIDRERVTLKRKLLVAAYGVDVKVGQIRRDTATLARSCAGAAIVPEIRCGSPRFERPALEVHEIVKRSRWRRGVIVLGNMVLLCQRHHDFTEDFPDDATERGLLAPAKHVHAFDKFEEGK